MRAGSQTSLLQRLLTRLQGAKGSEQPARAASKPRPFQAVAVFRGVPCCELARRFSEHRFLAKDAPSLPLPSCTMPHKCTCRFLKFTDRRESMQRRLMDVGIGNQMFGGRERRAVRGRRTNDR
ncbi:MAG: hypothetical protein ABW034_13500 [Steroidobacteraceae bacterium]